MSGAVAPTISMRADTLGEAWEPYISPALERSVRATLPPGVELVRLERRAIDGGDAVRVITRAQMPAVATSIVLNAVIG